jgi:hypothetical protein
MSKITCDKCGHAANEHREYIGCHHEHGEKICGCVLTPAKVREAYYKKEIKRLKAAALERASFPWTPQPGDVEIVEPV